MLANRRLSSNLVLILALLLIVIISFVVNFVGLSTYKAPPGSDYGNYLIQVDILRGHDLRGWGLRHNPVFFVLLDGFLRIFEDLTALKIVASLVFAIIAVPFFFLARKLSGSRLAALISTWIFVFFISNSEMISWGGNPNFLAFSFMLLAIFFFIDLMNEPSKKNMILSGFFLSLVIGTHILVAIYLLFSLFIIFISIIWKHRGISKVRIKGLFFMTLVTLIFSIPYVSFYLNFFSNSSDEITEFTLFWTQIPQISFINSLTVIVEFFVVIIISALSLFALSKYIKKEHMDNGLLLSILFLSPLLLALVTENNIRWFYFLPIPLLLCFGIYLGDLFFDIKISKKKTIHLLAICFIAIVGLQMTQMMFVHFQVAPEAYQFIEDDEIQAFEWIKENTPSNAIFATSGSPKGSIGGGGNSYAWWVEGYCKRLCVFSGDLKYFSYQRERDEIRIANHMLAGTYSAEYKNLRVTESWPSSTTNPEIAALIDKDYQDVLALNDEQHQLFFSPNGNEQELSIAPFYSKNMTSSIKYSDTGANITFVYNHPYFELSRSINMDEKNSWVDVTFRIAPKNATLNLFKINLWALFDTSLEDCNIDKDYVVSLFKPQPSSKEDMHAKIMVIGTNGKTEDAKVVFENSRNSRPVASYAFEPLQDSLYVSIRVSIDSANEDTDNNQAFRFYDSYDLIRDLEINYILVNINQPNEFQRFHLDSEHFTEEFQKGTIAIFEVN